MPTPVRPQSTHILGKIYRRPSEVPRKILDVLYSDPRKSNILLPSFEKASRAERQGTFSEDEVWVSCVSGPNQTLDFFASLTNGPVGKYPLFIYSTHKSQQLSQDSQFLHPRITCLVGELTRNMPIARVFSVFAADPVCRAFAELWQQHTGVEVEQEPYYAAKFSYCTVKTLALQPRNANAGDNDERIVLRKATLSDLPQTAELCYEFAQTSEPFTLSKSDATREATKLTKEGQLWVHEFKRQGQTGHIASIVAVTREAANVSAITKVCTSKHSRNKGCAERLVREVCRQLLHIQKKESVVLYVGHDNPAAKVYDRVGFVGLSGGDNSAVAWLELGFNPQKVELGHW